VVHEGWAEIERAADGGNAERVVDLCLALDERERRGLSKQAQALARRLAPKSADWIGDGNSIGVSPHRWAQVDAGGAAAFCLGPPPPARSMRRVPPGRLEQVVRSRPREWRDRWATRAVENEWIWEPWQVLRTLIREGECTKPDTREYTGAMVRFTGTTDQRHNVYEGLLEDPSLLEDDVWRIFELEEKVLSASFPGWWSSALIRLSEEQRLSRARLLDESLGSLQRDFAPHVAQSFASFHDQLAPTPEELAAREPQYLRLLGSPVESTIGFALKHLTSIERSSRIDGRELIEHAAPALAVRTKGHPKRCLALLAQVVKREPALVAEAVDVLIGGLSHEAGEVQSAVFDLLERHGDELTPEQRGRLGELTSLLDPSLRTRAATLAETTHPVSRPSVVAAVTVPDPISIDLDAIPRLRSADVITPVKDTDELLELAAVLLERQDDPDELERFVDGISRLCAEPIAAGRRTALTGRARAELDRRGPGTVAHAATAVAVLTLDWLEGPPPQRGFVVTRGPLAALGRRLSVVADRASSRRATLVLSAPSHRGGWLDPEALVARIRTDPEIEDNDLAQALLRLAPQGREQAAELLTGRRDEVTAVTRAALGAGGVTRPPLRSRLPAAWDAVEAIRSGSIEVEPRPARPESWPPPRDVAAGPMCPARLLALHSRSSREDGFQRWLAHIWPAHHNAYYEAALRDYGVESLWIGIAESETIGVVLELMLDPDEPLTEPALTLLATGLGSVAADRLLAADVVVEAIRTRRLPAPLLGQEIARVMKRPRAVPDRWAAGLQGVAAVSALHAHELQRIIESTLAELGSERPRITALLDLLRKLAQDGDARITNPSARAWLESTPPRSKTGQLARAALGVSGEGAQRSIDATAAAREGEHDQQLRRSP
jgi:hypothetical protein